MTACMACNGRKGDHSLKKLGWTLRKQPTVTLSSTHVLAQRRPCACSGLYVQYPPLHADLALRPASPQQSLLSDQLLYYCAGADSQRGVNHCWHGCGRHQVSHCMCLAGVEATTAAVGENPNWVCAHDFVTACRTPPREW